MKNVIFLFLTVYTISALSKCRDVEQTIYLGDVKVNGPIITPPSHIDINKKPGEVTIAPKLAIVSSNKKLSELLTTTITARSLFLISVTIVYTVEGSIFSNNEYYPGFVNR